MNTVAAFNRLVGRSFKESDIQAEQEFISAPLVDVNGEVGVEVSYLGSKEKFSATQLLAMLLGKISQLTAADTGAPPSCLAVAVPGWFTDRQRRATLAALDIVGISVRRLINENTAVALGYGIRKTDLPGPDEQPRRVMFVNIGHSSYTATIVEFRKGELAVKSTAFDRHYGGRNFDKLIFDHFQKSFLAKYKTDINGSPRLRFGTLSKVENTKKTLSANKSSTFAIDVEGVDFIGEITRKDFEALAEPLLARTTVPLEKALADAGLTKDDIDAVEMVGGTTRVPAVQARIQEFFGRELGQTLNLDEAVARGCAYASAHLSPTFRVREFAMHDIVSYPIEFVWEKANDIPDEEPNLVVFGKGNTMPSTKVLTFFRKRPFDLEARYYDPKELPAGMNPWIARFSVKGVKPTIGGTDDYMTCKLRARVNPDGVLNLDSAYYVEEQEVEEEIKEEEPKKEEAAGDKEGDVSSLPARNEQKDQDHHHRHHHLSHAFHSMKRHLTKHSQAMETDAPKEEVKPKTRKVRKQVRKDNLPVVSATLALEQPLVEDAREKEGKMTANDKLVIDTAFFKNTLEDAINDTRDMFTKSESSYIRDGIYADVSNDAEKEKVFAKLDDMKVRFVRPPLVSNLFTC